MQLQYTASFRYRMREYYRRVLSELQIHMDITWKEEPQYIGCSSLESVFTIECREDQQEEIERRLLGRLPVYRIEQWAQPEEYIDILSLLQSDDLEIIRAG